MTILSFTNHKYINVGGVHPTKTMESRTYCINTEAEMSISDVIDENNMLTLVTEEAMFLINK